MTAAAGAGRRRWPKVLAALGLLLALGFVWLRTPDIPADQLRAKYASPASRFLEVSPGFQVHVRDEGARNGPPLVLLHGSNASLHTFEPWVRRLSGSYRIITLDLQGHGLTGPIPSRCYSRACMAETVESVRAQLGLERFAIGGSSMGGGVAFAYALAHPEHVRALILIDPAGAPRAGARANPLGFQLAVTPVLSDIATVITPRILIERTLAQSVTVEQAASPEAVDRYWELLRYPGNRQATLERPFSAAATAQMLSPLRDLPVLILWGEADSVLPVSQAAFFKAALPEARLITYPGIGHLPQEETPDRSAADLAAFLRIVEG